MNNANSNDGGLNILGVLIVFYVFAGVGVLSVVTHGTADNQTSPPS